MDLQRQLAEGIHHDHLDHHHIEHNQLHSGVRHVTIIDPHHCKVLHHDDQYIPHTHLHFYIIMHIHQNLIHDDQVHNEFHLMLMTNL